MTLPRFGASAVRLSSDRAPRGVHRPRRPVQERPTRLKFFSVVGRLRPGLVTGPGVRGCQGLDECQATVGAGLGPLSAYSACAGP